jgi:hypothetical protein
VAEARTHDSITAHGHDGPEDIAYDEL